MGKQVFVPQPVSSVKTRTRNIRKSYRMIAEVGSGTYGRVYKAECLRTKEYVALKKFESKDEKVQEDGFPITAVREIRLLKQLDHTNVIKLREIVLSKASERNDFRGSTFLVFDYMDHDFAGLHRNKHEFSLPELKCVMLQILLGVQYLHAKKIIHRDLKIANILYNNQGEVKIADFGLARMLNPSNPKYTNKVVTLWYRAPEILLGAKEYTQQIDMWSVGCIFIELAVRENLLRGENESRQLEKIYELCGSTSPHQWPEVEKLQHWKDLKPKKVQERKLCEALLERRSYLDPELLNLIDGIMVLNPKKRATVGWCIDHPFFKISPLPLQPHEMPKIREECHEALLKNFKSRNQVINQKSNFIERQPSSPSRLLPKSYQPQLSSVSSTAQRTTSTQQQSTVQYNGGGNTSHFDQTRSNIRLHSMNGQTSHSHINHPAQRQTRISSVQSSSSQISAAAALFQKKSSLDMGSSSNNYPSIELHLDHNHNKAGGDNFSSSSSIQQMKLSSFSNGLASLLGGKQASAERNGGGNCSNGGGGSFDMQQLEGHTQIAEEEEDNTSIQLQPSKRNLNQYDMHTSGTNYHHNHHNNSNSSQFFLADQSSKLNQNRLSPDDDIDFPLKKKIKEDD